MATQESKEEEPTPEWVTLTFNFVRNKKGDILEIIVLGLREGPIIVQASVLAWLAKTSSEGGLWPYRLKVLGHDPHKLVAKCQIYLAWPQAEALRATKPVSYPSSPS